MHASPGPALWRVAKGRSELIIVGSVEPTPAGMTWNAGRVDDALRGARALLLSPGSTPGFAWAENFPDWERYLLHEPDGRSLGQELGEAPMDRVSRVALANGQPLSRYDSYRPGPAGMILLQDSWQANRFTGSGIEDAVIAVARAQHVRVEKIDEGGSLPLIDAMPTMSKAQHLACAEESLERFDWESANVDAVFRAWEDGAVGVLRQSYKPIELCIASIPGGERRHARARAIWIKTLESALNAPGRTVALMDVSELIGPNDVLASLEADGATVTPPPDSPADLPALERAADDFHSTRIAAVYLPKQDEVRLATEMPQLHLSVTSALPEASEQIVDLSGSDIVCVKELGTGTLLMHETCHSKAEWKQMELNADPDLMRDFVQGKRPPPSAF